MNQKITDYLNSIYQNTSTALQSINDILDKVENEELKKELKSQKKGYDEIHKECEKFAIENNIDIKDNNWFEKAKMWTSVKMSTLMDSTTRHITEMLLLGTIMGLNVCYKDKCDYKDVNVELDKLLKKLEQMEEKYYNNFKQFLKCDCDANDKKCKNECCEDECCNQDYENCECENCECEDDCK